MKNLFTFICCLIWSLTAMAHDASTAHHTLKTWSLTDGSEVEASFLMTKNDQAYLEDATHRVLSYPISALSPSDRLYVAQRQQHIQTLNMMRHTLPIEPKWMGLWALLTALMFATIWRWKPRVAMMGTTVIVLFGFTSEGVRRLFSTDPAFINSAFQPYVPEVHTFWDDQYFYVESKGIPTSHEMMAGITKWQQQVPIPQCYLGDNAWPIPLNPVLADTVVPVSPAHFTRGAIAIAANGVPIFNPYTNTGVDALVDGQLDNYGGHSGRADDYHYHIAPLHLEQVASANLPIAFALDGFAVYGSTEPDGTPMSALDEHHGHFGTDGVYHYHGTVAYPYMIGNMVGKVTEDTTHQIVPQAKAKPVRPSLTPLSGAAITSCTPNGTNGYNLEYTKNGQNFGVHYSWTPDGVYAYYFISPTDTITEVYNGEPICEVPVATRDLPQRHLDVLSAFPNPTRDQLYLRLSDGTSPDDVRGMVLYDLKGRVAYQSARFEATLPTHTLPKGVYLLKTTFRKGQSVQKIMIQ